MKSLNTLRLALAFCLLLAAPGQAQENPPGPGLQWHWGMPRFGGADLMAVAHGAGVWVAVGEGGTILVSRDAVIWTRQPYLVEETLTSVVWNGDHFVALGRDCMLNSTDGAVWSVVKKTETWKQPENRVSYNADTLAAKVKETLGNSSGCRVVASPGRIIAITEFGSIFSSTDGGSWQARPSRHPRKARAVLWADGKFVAVGELGMINTSADGINWRLVSESGGVGRWAASSESCVVLAASGSVTVVRSDKSARFSMPCGMLNGMVNAFGHTPHGFVFHAGTSVSPGIIGLSRDGMNWTHTELPPSRSTPCLMAAAGRRVVAVDSDGGTLLSDDGVVWRTSPKKAPYGLTCATTHGGRIVAAGSGAVGDFAALSQDGEDWEVIPLKGRMRFAAIASSGSTCVAVGEEGGIMTTSDFRTWSRYDHPGKPHLSAVAWSSGIFLVAEGRSGKVLLSADGRNWRQARMPGGVPLNSVTSRPGGGFVVSDATGRVLKSKDGVMWEVLDTASMGGEGPPLVACASNGSSFVAVGDLIMSSQDGMHWQPQYVPNQPPFSDICWGRGTWVAASVKNGFYFSPDGVNWERSTTAPPEEMLRSVVWTGSCFLAGGNAGLLFSSQDGRVWQRLKSPTSEAVYDLASDGRTVLALASGGVTLRCADTVGAQWQVAPTGLHTSLLRLCCTEEGHLAVGQDRGLYSCKDGQTWVRLAQNVSVSTRAVATGGGYTALAGSFGSVALSRDMKTWGQHSMDGGLLLMDVCYGGGRFVAVGLHHSIVYSDLVTPAEVK